MRFDWESLKPAIENADVISFDVFDTLVLRKVNRPEDIFYVMESYLRLPSFAEQRILLQTKASLKASDTKHKPHADLDEIYDLMAEESGFEADWEAVKDLEIGIECDAAMPNPDLIPVYEYAQSLGKRLIATSDMYLSSGVIRRILIKCGFEAIDAVYVSSEANATKYNADLFDYVAKKEQVPPEAILHIGDSPASDHDPALRSGWKAVLYEPFVWPHEEHHENEGILDRGVSHRLGCQSDDFWYDLGVYAGGPLYLGVVQWFRDQIAAHPAEQILMVSRDGYNLYHLLKELGVGNAAYLKMSRRSVLLAGLSELNETTLKDIPPFTTGQTVREVLAFLRMDQADWQHLGEAGFTSLDDVIETEDDVKAMHDLYVLNEKLFLEECAKEREPARRYLTSLGFGSDCLVFDCGWNGSSQYLLDRFLEREGLGGRDRFAFIGILDTEKSRRQLKNSPYDTYLFDSNRNRTMQDQVYRAVALFELFFGAPESSVWYYDENGPVDEPVINDESFKTAILAGIKDFIREALPFAEKYHIRYTDENAVSGVSRLIRYPIAEEAVRIGDIGNVDSFAAKKNKVTYMAKMSLEEYKANPNGELYWPQGLIARPDVEEELKAIIIGKYEMNKGDDKTLTVIPKTERERAEEQLSEKELYKLNKKRYGKRTADYIRQNAARPAEAEDSYSRWLAGQGKAVDTAGPLTYEPLFSVVVPVYNVSDEMLCACVDSILGQTYDKFELILVDDCSTWENVGPCLDRYKTNAHVKVIKREENGRISKATNTGILAAEGDFIVFSDCDDVLEKTALYDFARLLNDRPDLDFIYSDEDKLTEDGKRRHSPFFKPDWSPDTFMCLMYTNHLAAYRRSKVLETGLLRSQFDGTQDYDFTLRFMEHTTNDRVGHVPKILYHWRERPGSIASDMRAKPYAIEAMRIMKEDMLKRRGISGRVSYINDISQYRIVYDAPDDLFVSLVIPTKGDPDAVKACLESVFSHAGDCRYEIIVVDNGGNGRYSEALEDYFENKPVIRLTESGPFNASKMINRGAQAASGNYLMILSDDVEVVTDDFFRIMAGAAAQPHTGAVGAKLLYPNSPTIRHLGLINLQNGPAFALNGLNDHDLHCFGRNRADYNWLAVSGAALMIKKETFDRAGGFDEELTSAYYDADLCFRLYESGFYNVVRNDVILYQRDDRLSGEEAGSAVLRERKRLCDKHPALAGADPFYNVNLTPRKTDFGFDLPVSDHYAARCLMGNEAYQTYAATFTCFIDEVREADGYIHIKGWYYTGEAVEDNESDVEIILSSGRTCLRAPCRKTLREDARDNFDSQAYLVGFSVTIDAAELRPYEEYEIGVLVIRAKGRRKLYKATRQTLKNSNTSLTAAMPAETVLPASGKGVNYALDRFEAVFGRLFLDGWAFIDEIKDHFDTAVKLYLTDENGQVYRAAVTRHDRRDVARLFVPHRQLDLCGFAAEVDLPPVPLKRLCLVLYDPGSGRQFVRDIPLDGMKAE